MNNPVLVSESTLTDRYQTTIPNAVRKALHLNKREKIHYTIQSDGSVLMSRFDKHEQDPALGIFLSFLANDISQNPQHIQTISTDLLKHIESMVGDLDVDLDAPLLDEDE